VLVLAPQVVVVVHGHRDPVLALSDLLAEGEVLDLDVSKSVQGVGDPS
jgi:hypothetical protein